MTGTEYAAFLSYNSADRDAARRLQRALESYSVPKALRGRTTAYGTIGAQIGKVCRDRTDFKTGESLNAALIDALDRSSALIVLCSPDSAKSKWVNAEVEHFQRSGRSARIFPVVARTDDTGSVVNAFPPALRRADGDEAIAADLRPSGDGWNDGVIKVLAGILDVDFDALRQRALEAARRRARIAYGVAGGMGALAIVAVAASVMAIRQRSRAIENFGDAMVLAANSAERINEVANRTEVPRDLIYDLLTDTQADLESLSAMETLGRHPRARVISAEFQLLLSDLFAEVGRAPDQLASSLAAQRSLDTLKSSASNPTKLAFDSFVFGESNIEFFIDDLEGEVAESLGKAWLNAGALEKARAAFEQCRESRAEFLAGWELEAEETADVESGLLSCSANEANVLAMLDRPGAAIGALEADLRAAGDDAPSAPYAKLVLAGLYADNSRLKDAIALLTSEIVRYGDKTGRQERIELANVLGARARALAMTGRIQESVEDLSSADAVLSRFLAGDANDRRVLLLRGELLTMSGEAFALEGERTEAAARFSEAGEIFSRLVAFDERRRDWRLARARLLIARSDNEFRRFEADPRDKKSLARAATAAREAAADVEAVASEGDDVAERLSLVAQTALARILRTGGDEIAARRMLSIAAAGLREAGVGTLAHHLRVAMIADERGDLAAAAGAFREAAAAYDEALARFDQYLAEEPAAGLVQRDFLWTLMSSAKAAAAGGDAADARRRLARACRLAANAVLSEYSLFVRDAAALKALAREQRVRC